MTPDLEALVREAAAPEAGPRQTRAAARLMTALEQNPQRLPELYRSLPRDAWPQPRLVLGITGAPGSGKSTLTDALLSEWRQRHPQARLGVIAVDPSSPFTGGSLLGDRVRMMQHATDPMIFIRSLASRGHLGGLSLGVRGVLRVMALIGCTHVIVETVGVGQSEVEVAQVADLVLVVLAPGHGDAVQLLKAGLIEAGDLFVINKSDLEGASRLQTALASTLDLASTEPGEAPPHKKSRPDVLLVSAATSAGVPELADTLDHLITARSPHWQSGRRESALEEACEAVLAETRRRILAVLDETHLQRVLNGEVSIPELTRELLEVSSRVGDSHKL